MLRERSNIEGPANPKSWFPSQLNGNLPEGELILDKYNRKKHHNDKYPMTAYLVAGS